MMVIMTGKRETQEGGGYVYKWLIHTVLQQKPIQLWLYSNSKKKKMMLTFKVGLVIFTYFLFMACEHIKAKVSQNKR